MPLTMVWNVAGASELSLIWFGMFGCSQGYYETARQMRQAGAVNSVELGLIQPPISCLAYMGVSGNSVASSLSLQTHIVMYCHIYILGYIGSTSHIFRCTYFEHVPANHLGVGSARRRHA